MYKVHSLGYIVVADSMGLSSTNLTYTTLNSIASTSPSVRRRVGHQYTEGIGMAYLARQDDGILKYLIAMLPGATVVALHCVFPTSFGAQHARKTDFFRLGGITEATVS